MDTRSVGQLVYDALIDYEQESDSAKVLVLAVFNRTYEYYLLVQVWDRLELEPAWRHSLWYIHYTNSIAQHVCDLDQPRPRELPYVAAAEAVTAHILRQS